MGFPVALAALAILFVAGLQLPLGRGRMRPLVRVLGWVGALAAVGLACLLVHRHDLHLDATEEHAFTPSEQTQAVLEGLTTDVELTYFYQAQSPAGQATRQMVELMGRTSPRLKVRTVDPDQQPALANQLGVKLYNAALLEAEGRRVEVISTDDREIALGILRLLRRDARPVCFLTGHGEYDIDNFEFHTHFEGSHGHGHDALGAQVVQMEQHGIGRWRRGLQKLGYAVRRIRVDAGIPADCAALVVANPRTRFPPPDVAAIAAFLHRGGNLALLIEPDAEPGPEWTALLARVGLTLGSGVVSDPTSHYFTDEQMVAVERYPAHPVTAGLPLSFYPGARPIGVRPVDGVTVEVLVASSRDAVVVQRADRSRSAPAVQPLVVAATGRLDGGAPFRLLVSGDADFASNSFYPFLANADLALNAVSWLRGEPRGAAVKPAVEVLPTVALTHRQMQAIFMLCVVALPGLCALGGVAVWWRRRA